MTAKNRYRVKADPNPVYEAAARLAGVAWPQKGQALVIHDDGKGVHITLIDVVQHNHTMNAGSAAELHIEGFIRGDGYE